MSRNGKVVVAMSGGVDSSVAAALLKEQGYDCVGVFMWVGGHEGPQAGRREGTEAERDGGPEAGRHGAESWHRSPPPAPSLEGRGVEALPRLKQGCCGIGDACDARAVAAKLGIPFYSVNFQAEFARIIDYFVDEYARGRTPNPCVVCNTELKFGRLLRYADMLDAEFVATGHYARIVRDKVIRWEGDKGATPAGARSVPVPDGGRSPPVCLARALNRAKDQSYVLFGIRRADLSRCLFPLGDIADKADVRRIAAELGLPVHDKPESQEICFVPDNDYARLVRQRRPETQRPGEIRDTAGRVLGTHDGVANYTIGQRRGLGVAARTPIYVTRLDAATNTVVVGPRAELLSGGLIAERVNWLVDPPPAGEWQRAAIQIRYHHAAAAGAIRGGGLSEPRALASDERSTAQEQRPMAGDRLETGPTPSVGVQSTADTGLARGVGGSTADTAVPRGTGIVEVRFDEPQSAVTPGQAAVFYDGDIVLGGGWISRADTMVEGAASGATD